MRNLRIVEQNPIANLDMDTTSPACTGKQHVYLGYFSDTQINRRSVEYRREEYEKCKICFNDVNVNEMHEIRSCNHRYCYSCMDEHVQYRLRLYGGVPECPHEGCYLPLIEDDCKKFLSSKLFETFAQRVEEAKIPDSKKLYCPYPSCSALMTAEWCPQDSSSSSSLSTECHNCRRLFCIECRVPWHMGMSCQEYSSQFGGPDAEVHMLAEKNKWRLCPKCKHMIERLEGCLSMICRYCFHSLRKRVCEFVILYIFILYNFNIKCVVNLQVWLRLLLQMWIINMLLPSFSRLYWWGWLRSQEHLEYHL